MLSTLSPHGCSYRSAMLEFSGVATGSDVADLSVILQKQKRNAALVRCRRDVSKELEL